MKKIRDLTTKAVVYPLAVFGFLFLATLNIWHGFVQTEARRNQLASADQTENIAQQVERGLEERVTGLQRMVSRWEYRGGTPKNEWVADISNYYRDMPGFLAFSWIDQDFIIRWIYPENLNQHIAGTSARRSEERIHALDLAKLTHKPAFTRSVDLLVGGIGFGLYLPVYVKGKFQGIISAGFRHHELLGKLVHAEGYLVQIREDKQVLFNSDNKAPTPQTWAATKVLKYRTLEWTIEVSPTTAVLTSPEETALTWLVLLGGILFAILAGALVRYFLISREQEAKAQISLQWQNAIFESTPQLIIATDPRGVIVTFNPAAEKYLGYKATEVIGKLTPLAFRDPAEVEAKNKALTEELGTPIKPGFDTLVEKAKLGVVEEQEVTYVKKDGTKTAVSLIVSAIRDSNGEISGYLGVVSDIAAKKQAIAAIEQAKESALETSKAKSAFLANMSHEIRTPLNGIIGMTDLLIETPLDEQQKRWAKIIQDSGTGLLNIINDILDFSKIEAGKLNLELISFRLVSVIEGQIELLTARAREKNISLMAYIDPAISENIQGDPGRIGQVLLNLTGNAVKFTDQGSVVVSASLKQESADSVVIEFSVKDTGIGISELLRKDLFAPFTQADSSTARKFGGTGLGLSICKRLVELMDGSIGVDSELGKGSNFWFTVRLKKQKTAELIHLDRFIELKGLRALVVDDDTPSREIVCKYLESWGLEPTVTDNGQDGLMILKREKVQGKPFDLAIVDKRMPGMDGFLLLEKVQQTDEIAKTPIILMTAFDRSNQFDSAIQAGFKGYITKPIKQSELYNSIVNSVSPASQIPKKESVAPTTSQAQTVGDKPFRILIAEDNGVNQLLILTILKKLKYPALAVANGKEVLEAVASAHYDLILMDCQMPEMDGFQATQEIRKREKETGIHIPIIALTANAMKEDEDRCLAAGMDGYLSKPIKVDKLTAMLDRWLIKIKKVG